MITAIPNFKGNNLTVSSVKQIKSNPIYNTRDTVDFTKLKQSNQISFKGNLAKVGENVLGDIGSKFGGKVRRFGEEVAESARGFFRKLKGKEELPFAEKPITCEMETNEKMQKELEKKAKEWTDVKFRKADSETAITGNGGSVSSGDIDSHGYLTTSGKKKAGLSHHEDIDNNSDGLNNNHDKTSFRGNEDGVKKSDVDVDDTDLKGTDTDLDMDLDKDLDLELDKDLDLDLDLDKDLDLDIDVDPDIDFDPTDLF